MELVAECRGVRFVNDSKATNVESALRSIESFASDLVPIIGGRFKVATCDCFGARSVLVPGLSWRWRGTASRLRRAA